MRLTLYPVQSIASVKYIDTNGDEQTVSSDDYDLIKRDGHYHVAFKSDYVFPALSITNVPVVKIQYVAGYATAPAALCHAILLMVGAWYENREETVIGVPVARLPESVAINALISPYRRIGI